MVLLLIGLLCINSNCDDKREAYIKTVVEWHILLVILIYALSIGEQLNVIWITVFFHVANICIWGLGLKTKRIKEIRKIFFGLTLEKIYIIPCIMAFIALWFALDTLPYNWDSMTYHLPRLAHWTQNQSVAPYASHIDRQVGSTTLASYVTLMVYILSGKRDIFLNLVQCMAYISNAVFLYGIARKCNVSKKFSVVASALYMAMPIAFAEATTTQNDNYSTMWMLFFVYLLLDFIHKDISINWNKKNIEKVICAAACMGFGYLAKPSVCFAMVIFLFFILWNVVKRKDRAKDIFKLIGIALTTLIITVLPQFLFNLSVYGKALPDNVGKRQLVGTLQPNYLFINFVKNVTYNLGNSVFPKFKEGLSSFLYGLADVCRVDLNDTSISEDGGAFGFSSHPYGCDTALNPLILVLAILCVIWCLVRLKKQASVQIQFTLFSMVSYIVFCVALRWEHFISRYLLTYFALLCPLVAIQLQDVCFVMKNINVRRMVLVGLFLIFVVNYSLVIKNAHDIETKEYPDSYFYHIGGMRNGYIDICEEIIERQYKEIGLICGNNSYEYPLWGILNSQSSNFVIRHVGVEGVLSQYEDTSYSPECILVLYGMDEVISVNGCEYVKLISHEESNVYLYEKIG